MNIFRARRDVQDIGRLRDILAIIARRGFRHLLAKGRLRHHLPLVSEVRDPAPADVREMLEELGPTFVKLGQALSLRPDLIPQSYADAFRTLQDHVPPLSFGVIQGVVEHELGKPLDKVFSKVEPEPLAAASIAQVHAATLRSGEEVVLKVQRPGIKAVMERDIDILNFIARHLDRHYPSWNLPELVKEFERYTERELDFTFEARNARKLHDFFAENEHVVIPEPRELSTERLLLLDRIRGVPLSDCATLQKHHISRKQLCDHYVRAMFDQVFSLGIAHADPHPGNLMAVRGNKIAFLDFGIVTYLDDELQELCLRFVSYILRKDARGVVWVLLKISHKKLRTSPEKLQSAVSLCVLEWYDSSMREDSISHLIYKLILLGIDHGLEIPANVTLFAKSLVTIEGTAGALDPNFNFTTFTTPLITEYLRRRWAPDRLAQRGQRIGETTLDLLEEAPFLAKRLAERIKEGRVDVGVDWDQLARVEQQYDLESTKRALATVSAALFIGSALIAGLAPELVLLEVPLTFWGFGLFIASFIIFTHVAIKSHKYAQRDR